MVETKATADGLVMVDHEKACPMCQLQFCACPDRQYRLPEKANEVQYGGDHYKQAGSYQHWDFVYLSKMDYYQGNASKYVTRWRKKNGKQDLRKAKHYLMKRRELKMKTRSAIDYDYMVEYCKANGLDGTEQSILIMICRGKNRKAAALIDLLLAEETPLA